MRENMNLYDNPEFFEAYAQMDRSRFGLSAAGEWPQLSRILPDLSGLTVLDLGCGYGWHCEYCARCGAKSVLGLEMSERMLHIAACERAYPNVEYRLCDLLQYEYPQESFDLVLSNLVLHYVQDLDWVFARVYQTLKPGGTFVCNIEHPVFTAGVNQEFVISSGEIEHWPVDNYFYPGERRCSFLGHEVVKQHHTLTQIVMGLLKVGFVLEVLEEVEPPESFRDAMPEEMKRPMMLLIRCRKA